MNIGLGSQWILCTENGRYTEKGINTPFLQNTSRVLVVLLRYPQGQSGKGGRSSNSGLLDGFTVQTMGDDLGCRAVDGTARVRPSGAPALPYRIILRLSATVIGGLRWRQPYKLKSVRAR